MHLKLKSALGLTALVLGTHAMAQVTFYEGEGFRGRAVTTDKRIADFDRLGFNNGAGSLVVDRGRWEVCDDTEFDGQCVVVRRGSYDSLSSMGLNSSISSVRPVAGNRNVSNEVAAPLATPNYDYYRRPNERVFEAPVTSALVDRNLHLASVRMTLACQKPTLTLNMRRLSVTLVDL